MTLAKSPPGTTVGG